MAAPGYDYTKSLINAGGNGPIMAMSGGGDGVPPTNTYNAGASLIQPIQGVPIPSYRGGFLDEEDGVFSGGEGNPGIKSTVGQERLESALRKRPQVAPSASTGPITTVNAPTTSSSVPIANANSNSVANISPDTANPLPATEVVTTVAPVTVNTPLNSNSKPVVEVSQPSGSTPSNVNKEDDGIKTKDIVLFGESITLDNPEKDGEPFTESQIKSLKAFGLDGSGINDTQKRDVLKALYEGKCNTSQPLIMLEQCEPIRRIVQSLALNLLSKLGTNGKPSLNITKEEEPEVKYEKLGDGSMKLSILFKPGQLGLLSKFKPEVEKKTTNNKVKSNNKGGPSSTPAEETVVPSSTNTANVSANASANASKESSDVAVNNNNIGSNAINESKLNEELTKLISEMEKLEKNEVPEGGSKNNSIKQLTITISGLKNTIEKLSKNVEGFSELLKDQPELSEKINKIKEFQGKLKNNAFKNIPNSLRNPLNEELEKIFDYLKNNNNSNASTVTSDNSNGKSNTSTIETNAESVASTVETNAESVASTVETNAESNTSTVESNVESVESNAESVESVESNAESVESVESVESNAESVESVESNAESVESVESNAESVESVESNAESVASNESNTKSHTNNIALTPEIIEFQHEIEQIKNKGTSLNNSSIVDIIHKIVNNPQNSRLSKENAKRMSNNVDEFMEYLNNLPPNVSGKEKVEEIKREIQPLMIHINSEYGVSNNSATSVESSEEYKNCTFTAEQLNEKYKITEEIKNDKGNKFDIMKIPDDGWCLYSSIDRSTNGKFTEGGSSYSFIPELINKVADYLKENKEKIESENLFGGDFKSMEFETQGINGGPRKQIDTIEEYIKYLTAPRDNSNLHIQSDAKIKCKDDSNNKIKEYFEFENNSEIVHIPVDKGPALWPDLQIVGKALAYIYKEPIYVFIKEDNEYKKYKTYESTGQKGIYILFNGNNHFDALLPKKDSNVVPKKEPFFVKTMREIKEKKKQQNENEWNKARNLAGQTIKGNNNSAKAVNNSAKAVISSPLISNNQEDFLKSFNLPKPTGNVLGEMRIKKQQNEEKRQENQKKNNKLMNTMIKKRQNETKNELEGVKNTMKFLGNRESARKSFLNPANKNNKTMNKITKKRQNETKKELENIKQYKKVSGEEEKKSFLNSTKGGKRKTFKKAHLKLKLKHKTNKTMKKQKK
jgi:hypothetical protein